MWTRAHGGAAFACNWCKKIVNRRDNLLSHLKLHTLNREGGRVAYEPGAMKEYEEEIKRIESRRGRKPASNKKCSAY